MSRPPQTPLGSPHPQAAGARGAHRGNGASPEQGASNRAPRGPGRFTQDLIKILKAAQKAGTPIASVRIEPDGTILVVPGTPQVVASSCAIRDAADIISVD